MEKKCAYYNTPEVLANFPLDKCDLCPHRKYDEGLMQCDLFLTTPVDKMVGELGKVPLRSY